MAKKSVCLRDDKRRALVIRFAERRQLLKQTILEAPSYEEKMAASHALQKLPRDSSRVRLRNRCEDTGRPRGYYRRFGLSRQKMRESAMRGEVPGLTKSSW